MRSLSPRSKLVGGAFCLVAVAWAIDLLTGGPGPSPAGAAPSPAVSAPLAAPPAASLDLDALIDLLRSDPAPRSPLRFDELTRDLFVPTPSLIAALPPAVPPTSPETGSPKEPVAEPVAFDARHELQGVLTGRVTLAVIDGGLFRRGAQIDGYRLVELHRDYVVFERDGARVVLRVATADRRE